MGGAAVWRHFERSVGGAPRSLRSTSHCHRGARSGRVGGGSGRTPPLPLQGGPGLSGRCAHVPRQGWSRGVAQTPPDRPRVMAGSQVFFGGRGHGKVFGQARSRASRARCQRNYGHVACATSLCCGPSDTTFFGRFGEMSGATASLAGRVRGLRLQRHDCCCAVEPQCCTTTSSNATKIRAAKLLRPCTGLRGNKNAFGGICFASLCNNYANSYDSKLCTANTC